VDIADGETEVPIGQPGEVVVRGPMVMKGYWQRDDETAQTIDQGGWLYTGDICKVDADGFFYIVDRKKDMIIASGFKVLPRDVEEVLFQHPKVLEAAVVGVPHPKRGDDTVTAFVVPKAGERLTIDELRDFCKAQLAPYKVPREWEFRDELPKTTVGKVLRRVLVEEEKRKHSAAAETHTGETAGR
jgi:long-chain acyl-CoA synthetase